MAQIDKPNLHFNTVLYTGNGSDNHAITGVGFQPDFVWIKTRSTTGFNRLQDAVRGATKEIYSNSSQAESTDTNTLKSFDSDGFTLGTTADYNGNGRTQVSWNWKANGAGSANSDGSQSSTVSVNTTAGFSIVKFVNNQSYTTNTFGHGLGAVPKMIMMRSLDDAYNWDVHHNKIAISKRLVLNSSAAESSSTYMNSTSPTNQVFTVKSDEFGSNSNCIAYCFAEKKGFSKFGSYTGNGNADGPFVYTGFKPAFVMVKNTATTGESWMIQDAIRSSYNPYGHELIADGNNTEYTSATRGDFLSNGFKLRTTSNGYNDSLKYIYMAFSENPIVGSNNIPATAR